MRTINLGEFDDAIGVIRGRYLANLAYLTDVFLKEIDQVKKEQDIASAIAAIRQHSHKICGVAPTLGLLRLGEFGMQVELLATELQNGIIEAEPLSELFIAIEEMLDHMQELRRQYDLQAPFRHKGG
ncbi:hypothetical protein [Aliiroseovarius sp. YM-037]|uniref:hypothetical protein n=1 Tax=Aliiroseovarius sp. YM-037 TaxID=3341728 RepID=UPI003A808059